VKHAHVETGKRDDYWESARDELKTAQNRADLFTLMGLAALCGLLWAYHEPGDGFTAKAVMVIAFALVVIGVPLWFVTRRKRQISARHLTCPHCGTVPHDTEIAAAVGTRHCQRCDHTLD